MAVCICTHTYVRIYKLGEKKSGITTIKNFNFILEILPYSERFLIWVLIAYF